MFIVKYTEDEEGIRAEPMDRTDFHTLGWLGYGYGGTRDEALEDLVGVLEAQSDLTTKILLDLKDLL